MPKTTKTKEKDMPNENKQCCEKCLGTHFREAGTNSWQEVTTPSCMDSNCPCHQEEKEWEARERIGEKPFDTPSQEENHSIHCECLKCFTEEPPKEEKEVLMGDFLEEMKRDISTPSQEEKMPPDAEFLNRKREEIGLNLDAPVKKNGLVGTMASLTDEQDEAIEDEASALRRNPSRDSVYLYQLIHSLLATKIEIDEVVGMIEGMKYAGGGYPIENWQVEVNETLSSLKQKLLEIKE